jgi:hypothetical protein
MDKEHSTDKPRPDHKPIDPDRAAARENRVPMKETEPRRSDPTPEEHRKDAPRP